MRTSLGGNAGENPWTIYKSFVGSFVWCSGYSWQSFFRTFLKLNILLPSMINMVMVVLIERTKQIQEKMINPNTPVHSKRAALSVSLAQNGFNSKFLGLCAIDARCKQHERINNFRMLYMYVFFFSISFLWITCPLDSLDSTTLDKKKKKNHPRDSRREKRCSTCICDIMLDQGWSAQGKGRIKVVADSRGWPTLRWSLVVKHDITRSNSVLLDANLGSGSFFLFFFVQDSRYGSFSHILGCRDHEDNAPPTPPRPSLTGEGCADAATC